ncbi:CU044_2847 family protein [Streptomyces sp. NPDC046727]|uniref:CU044_2847 family protein n=1 Tax=Streptomyces sp. NPDC046727 TaxID=3155373 RepID=UPI0033DD82A7
MDGLVDFRTEDGALVVVEGVGSRSGARLVSRGDGAAQATRTFEGALEGVRAAAAAALRVFRDGTPRPDTIEIEFGVRMSAEAGAVIAKGTAEGHLVVKLSWSPAQQAAQAAQEPAAVPELTAPAPDVPNLPLPGQTVPGPESADR